MDSDQIVSRMNTYLHTSANVLAEWLGKLLPRTSEDWWEDCVIAKLSYNQAEMVKERGFHPTFLPFEPVSLRKVLLTRHAVLLRCAPSFS